MSVHHGDCLEVMPSLDAESVDAIVTDPPYDLLSVSRNGSRRVNNPDTPAGRTARGFMGKAWDGTGVAFRAETWAAALRVAKPGAHLLAFGGTRTVHRMTCAIEDAGWEIRDCLVWAYASGFPKSHNLEGDWTGWGTALKPAWEPIVLARKPLAGTVAANVARHGTGALNIDGTRIDYDSDDDQAAARPGGKATSLSGALAGRTQAWTTTPATTTGTSTISTIGAAASAATSSQKRTEFQPTPTTGRWPANVILTDPVFDGEAEGVVGGGESKAGGAILGDKEYADIGYHGHLTNRTPFAAYGDEGTYSRFFLISKADRAEREPFGLDTFEGRREQAHSKTGPMDTPYLRGETVRRNTHPTVKPVDLMRHLVRLVTPPGGLVLDPFLGSGTTAIAAEMEGFRWLGIEREAEYVAIAEARLNGTQRGLGLPA